MKRGEILKLNIENLDGDGCGSVLVNNRLISVRGALPGDEITARVTSVKRHNAKAAVESIEHESIKRIEPACPHFGICGGCSWQNISYAEQCLLKKQLTLNMLSEFLDEKTKEEISVIPSPDIYFYRNKMEFSFDIIPGGQEGFVCGLHQRGRFDRVFDVTDCRLESDDSNKILSKIRRFFLENDIKAYGMRNHEGVMRFLVIREGKNTGETLLNLVISGKGEIPVDKFVDFIKKEIPSITSLLLTVNSGLGSVVYGEKQDVLYGTGNLREKVCDYEFIVSPDAFFQTNTRQTENLYSVIKDFADIKCGENILDLYCGTGTIGIFIAEKAGSVTGIEILEPAIVDAEINAKRNDIKNTNFIAGSVEKTLDGVGRDFDIMICDPPRAGIHPKAMYNILLMRIPRIVYVSCNIKALKNDLGILTGAGYRIADIKVLDMSPHTPATETVVKLEI